MSANAHDQYEWLDPREAIRRRPDTHVGAVTPQRVQRVVLLPDGTSRAVDCDKVSPALLKMIDEVVTNALDHRVRDPGMKELRVDVEEDGSISVANDGHDTITTTLWPGTDKHTPQVLFHEVNAGSNLGAVNAHNVGGRNGVGATVVNLLSTSLDVEVDNAKEGTAYSQRFEAHGTVVHPPRLKAYKLKTARTRLFFSPDYALLGMPEAVGASGLDDDVRALLVGRAVDAAACTDATVYVNGARVNLKTLQKYALAYGGELLGRASSSAG